jgi:hypothetical protein
VFTQALWFVSNLACDTERRGALLDYKGTVELVMSLCREGNLPQLRLAARTASNFFWKMNVAQFDRMRPHLPDMVKLTDHADDEVAKYGLIALSSGDALLNLRDEWRDERIRLGVVPRAIALLKRSPEIAKHALAIAGDMCSGNDVQCQAALDAGLLPNMLDLLNRCVDLRTTLGSEIRRIACWTLCNIAGGTQSQRRLLINSHFVPVLREIVRDINPEERRARFEAAWAISHLIRFGDELDIRLFVYPSVRIELNNVIQTARSPSSSNINFGITNPANMCESIAEAIAILEKKSFNQPINTNQLMQPE